jgi:hypothetical protein
LLTSLERVTNPNHVQHGCMMSQFCILLYLCHKSPFHKIKGSAGGESIVWPMHPIVHWLPNKIFAWPQRGLRKYGPPIHSWLSREISAAVFELFNTYSCVSMTRCSKDHLRNFYKDLPYSLSNIDLLFAGQASRDHQSCDLISRIKDSHETKTLKKISQDANISCITCECCTAACDVAFGQVCKQRILYLYFVSNTPSFQNHLICLLAGLSITWTPLHLVFF